MKPFSRMALKVCVTGLALTLLQPFLARANPYASGIANNDGTIQFILNENADSLYAVLNDGTTNTLSPARGLHSFVLGTNTSYSIYAVKAGSGAYSQISFDLSNSVHFFGPRGVGVNQNPQRSNFGRTYVINSWPGAADNGRAVGKGLYLLNADQTDALGQGDSALIAGMQLGTSLRYSPYRVSVGSDDTVYVSDAGGYYTSTTVAPPSPSNGTAAGGLWAVTPDFSSSMDLFNQSDAMWNGGVVYGGVIGTPFSSGSPARSNLVMCALEWDLVAPSPLPGYETVWRYVMDTNTGALPLTGAPAPLCGAPLGSANGIISDMAIHPNGNIYVMQNRVTGTGAGNVTVTVFDSTGAINLWDSQTVNGGIDPWINSYGIAISPDGKYLANLIGTGFFVVTQITNGVPDRSTSVTTAIAGAATGLNSTRGSIAWDAADNLYLTLTSQATIGGVTQSDSPTVSHPALLRVYSPGFNATAITRNDSTATNGAFQLIVTPPRPTITAATVVGGNPILTFTTPASDDTTASFLIQGATAANGSFTDVSPAAVIAQTAAKTFQATLPQTGPVHFYRIRHL